MASYSIEHILVSSGVTFVLSGLLGALFKDWLDRARIDVVVQSFGLAPSIKLLELKQELRDQVEKCPWSSTLHRFENFSTLYANLMRMKRINETLRMARTVAEEWLVDNRTWEGSSITAATIEEMAVCPIMRHAVIISSLTGSALRSDLKPPNATLDDLGLLASVTDLTHMPDGFILYMRNRNILFPSHEHAVESQKRAIQTLAASFSKGHKANIYHYMSEFKRICAEEINLISEIIQKLEQVLTPESLLETKVSIINHGAKAATIRPFAQMQFHNAEVEQWKPLMRIRVSENHAHRPHEKYIQAEDESEEGDEVMIEDLFPISESNSYVLLPPKSITTLVLTSEEPLGKNAERILGMYKAAVLRSSVVVLTIEHQRLESPSTLFGQGISDDERRLLTDAKKHWYQRTTTFKQ